jgi:hypothetical protein
MAFSAAAELRDAAGADLELLALGTAAKSWTFIWQPKVSR